MSLNRYEQAMFDYWGKQPDERRHWQIKVIGVVPDRTGAGETARGLERELWAYFAERYAHVALFRDLQPGGLHRVSMLNLAEQILRIWGPPPKPGKPSGVPPA